ncbi:MAG: ABC transporter permease [Actinobacteria bacterium]|nr:ABC transporter permease [Actinomycetota bacterium]
MTSVAAGTADTRVDEREHRVLQIARYVAVPVVVALACGLMYLYVQGRELDSIEGRLINASNIRRFATEQITISLWATAFTLLVAIPLGIALTRPWARRISPYIVAIANVGQGTPAVGLVFLAFVLRISRVPTRATIIAMVIYAMLPVLRGTMVGLQQVDRGIIKAARGMGMSKLAVLARVEMPLSVPILLTGVRTTLVLTVATSVLGAFIGAGTFGQLIVGGFAQSRMLAVAVGSLGAAALAIMADWLGGIAEDFLRPKGL